jgi:Icc-related predicted phosphoesterase
VHEGLAETIAALRPIEIPVVLVPGNNETDSALRRACADWPSAKVLHGERTEIDGLEVFGLGAGIPITPWDWSFDLDEDEAALALADCPEAALLVVHSPPYGHVDRSRGRHLGSRAILEAISARAPRIAVCGHIHESWGQRSRIGDTPVLNLGPEGVVLEL